MEDFERITADGHFCIAGDLNMTFTDNYYFTETGRKKLNDCFQKLELRNLTENIPNNIDHIIISNDFLKDRQTSYLTWNEEKKLTDHIGVCVTIND